MYHLPRVCRTLVSEIRVRPEMLRVFRYIDVLTCVCISQERRERLELLVSHGVCRRAVKNIDEDR